MRTRPAGREKDLALCSTCQAAPPTGLVAGRVYTTCEPCYAASQAKRRASKDAKRARLLARIGAAGKAIA